MTCPHCGKPSGAAPNRAVADAALALAILDEHRSRDQREAASEASLGFDDSLPFGLLDVVAGVVGAAIHAASEPRRPPEPVLPRAVARERPRLPTVDPIASEAPEPAPPPGDQPRYLK